MGKILTTKSIASVFNDLEPQDDDISVSHQLPKNEAFYCSRLNDGTASSVHIVDKALQFPKIIVKFVNKDTKELFYKSRKQQRILTWAEYQIITFMFLKA